MYTFVLNTTIGKTLTIPVEPDTTTIELHKIFVNQLEKYTLFCEKEILDIFAQDTLNNDTLSFPKNDLPIKSFIHQNRDFYPPSIMVNDKYELYVIDTMYNERIRNNLKNIDKIPPARQIKTSHGDSFIQLFKSIFAFII
jgi:hypothetical protein